MPGLKGPQKKQYFNELSGWVILAAGVGGLLLGLACFGPLGAVMGLGAGVAAGSSFAESNRFYRD